jgi:nicastrin
MFDGLYPGAMDSLASIATLVSTAHFLRKIISNENYEKNKMNVLFVLFNGESYDYIGSQRFVYDLKKNAFPSPSSYTRPINFENIHMMIDLGAIDTFDRLSIYHRGSAKGLAYKLQDSISFYSNKLTLNVEINPEETDNIPPVSAQMFLRENMTFPALIVAAKEPLNKFYHSIYDDANNLNYTYQNSSRDFDQTDSVGGNSPFADTSVQIKIRNIATALGLAVYDMLVDDPKKYTPNMIASAELVDEVIYCYLISTKCKLFQAAFEHDARNYAPPLQRYVSVSSPLGHEVVGWTYRVLGFVLSEKIEKVKENCTTLPYYWLPGSSKKGECRYTTQNFSLAYSPAFEEEENYNYSSNYYSTWTESTWHDLSARIFLRPSSSHEYLTLTVGIIVFVLSFIIVYVVNSKAEVLFGDAVIAEQ